MIGLDTNVLARYYVADEGDVASQRAKAREWIESGRALFVAKTVVLELEWVLRGVYGHSRGEVCSVFDHLLSLPHVTVEDREAVELALDNARRGFDFADALHHASSRHCEALLTFDARGFAARARRSALTPVVRVPA